MIFLKTESLQQPGRVSIETSRSLQRIVAERFAGLAAVAAAAQCLGGRATYDLGQVEGIISNRVENEILQSIHNVEELFAQGRHSVDGLVRALRFPVAVVLQVNNDGFGGFEMGAGGAQGRSVRAEDAELARKNGT